MVHFMRAILSQHRGVASAPSIFGAAPHEVRLPESLETVHDPTTSFKDIQRLLLLKR